MGQRAVLGLLCAISAVVWGATPNGNSHPKPQADISSGGKQLVGTWRLISRVVTLEDGTAVQDPGLGKTPSGYLIYDSSGHMAAQLMRPDRPMASDCGTSGTAPSENSQSVNGYDAYFGTYTIDEASHTVTHHLEGALAAADVGKNLAREFQLSGDKLTIIVRTNSPKEKEKQIRTLLWERVH
jgi:Lipocalin-like domain